MSLFTSYALRPIEQPPQQPAHRLMSPEQSEACHRARVRRHEIQELTEDAIRALWSVLGDHGQRWARSGCHDVLWLRNAHACQDGMVFWDGHQFLQLQKIQTTPHHAMNVTATVSLFEKPSAN